LIELFPGPVEDDRDFRLSLIPAGYAVIPVFQDAGRSKVV